MEENFQAAIENVRKSKKNKGEKDEVMVALKLFYYNQKNEYDKLIEIFGEEASQGIHILNMDTNDEILDISKLSKAGSGYKADCKIKMKKTGKIWNSSIKSKNGAKPAILNHTPRSAKVFKETGYLYENLSYLDIMIKEYIDKRKSSQIGEDIFINELECLKNDNTLKEKFKNVLRYFVFDGTGKGYSKCKANSIIEYENDKITFTGCDNEEKQKKYIESIYHKIVVSLRNKGMPKQHRKYCEPWIFEHIKSDGSIKQKGSLHIRMK